LAIGSLAGLFFNFALLRLVVYRESVAGLNSDSRH
jgi:hypothetical protein